jgi:hypothetical protein
VIEHRQAETFGIVPATDMHGFPMAEPIGSADELERPSSASTAAGQYAPPGTTLAPGSSGVSSLQYQQTKLREERDRLRRLQEIDEMDARLEEQLKQEREEERKREIH